MGRCKNMSKKVKIVIATSVAAVVAAAVVVGAVVISHKDIEE